jgi:hypothetical protein
LGQETIGRSNWPIFREGETGGEKARMENDLIAF